MSTQDQTIEGSETSIFDQLTMEPQFEVRSGYRANSGTAVFLKVAVPATACNVKLSFDPVSLEQARQTRELNRSVRLGFIPPVASTR